MFTVLAYFTEFAAAGDNQDLPAVADPQFPLRNGHFCFTEHYNLIQTVTAVTNASQCRYNVPSWNVFGPNGILDSGSNVLMTQSSPLDQRWDYPTPIPLNEEFAIQCDTLAPGIGTGSEAAIWIATPHHTRSLPRGIHRLQVFVDFGTPTFTAGQWSPLFPITLPANLRGGVYAVIGASIQGTECALVRLVFPQGPTYQGRKLRPGTLTLPATTGVFNLYQPQFQNYWGEWGRFHTFQPPSAEFFGVVSAVAATVQGWLDLVYLGEHESLIFQQPPP